MQDYQGIMTAIDFEKAFDSLNWNFLLKSIVRSLWLRESYLNY